MTKRAVSVTLALVQDVISLKGQGRKRRLKFYALARENAPTLTEWGLSALASGLLILSFPDFNLWPLAWIGLVPLMVAITQRPHGGRSFLLGWIAGAVFFYGSCYWLTHAMIHYGGIPRWIAYVLLVPAVFIVGLFPALWSFALARTYTRWGARALLVAPFFWTALEWARLGMTGQLWNAIGYSQAYQPSLIQAASWGGVHAVGFLIVTVNATIAYLFLERNTRSLIMTVLTLFAVTLTLVLSASSNSGTTEREPAAVVVAVQPNVPVDFGRSAAATAALVDRHLSLSADALRDLESETQRSRNDTGVLSSESRDKSAPARSLAHLVVWPESPMNFTYAQDAEFRAMVGRFAQENRTSVLFNSLEPAPANGVYNSAVMVNKEGRLVAQYDKIRLLPFGEYVPVPRWLPGTSLVGSVVGDFTPGDDYPLMPLGEARIGVFICFESAFPSIARKFSEDGADALINISNDGYLGQTPVLRQHLANAVFRAVENNRPVLRVTNTGISAYISPRGEVTDATESFQPAVRIWTVARATGDKTFYTNYGDIFAATCTAITILVLVLGTISRQQSARS